mmetsp:Transcript_106006/g.187777  ORF Transcript_106006/g.187777 Transcript_106006/m.187777 type:complete len:107 (+) Transcript_106006:1625-1945(+)
MVDPMEKKCDWHLQSNLWLGGAPFLTYNLDAECYPLNFVFEDCRWRRLPWVIAFWTDCADPPKLFFILFQIILLSSIFLNGAALAAFKAVQRRSNIFFCGMLCAKF